MTELAVLTKNASAAWHKYGSTVCLGGTPEQRRWAFDQAYEAEDKLRRLERLDRLDPDLQLAKS